MGGYSQTVPFMEDYELWLRMLAQGYRFANLPLCLVNHRTGNGMLTKRRGISYAKSELILHGVKKRLGFKTRLTLSALRFCSRLLPSGLLSPIYGLLRQPKAVSA